MDDVVIEHFKQCITEKTELTGGYSFQTWRLTLEDGRSLVYRASPDICTGGGRKIVIADVFKREKYFYDTLNSTLGHICPEVFVIGATDEHTYQISEFLEGVPLDKCFDKLNKQQQREVSFRYGEIAAGINQIKIDKQHPFAIERGPWERFFANRLGERLKALVRHGLITDNEIDKIARLAQGKRAANSLSFLHLDLRPPNLIYKDGDLFVIDAENCEFGDPLFELAALAMNDYLCEDFLAGYEGVFGSLPDLTGELFYLYQMERAALVLSVYIDEVEDEAMRRRFAALFESLKERFL